MKALQISQLLRDYTSAVMNSNPERLSNGSISTRTNTTGVLNLSKNSQPSKNQSNNSIGRRKSVEFDLALRNCSTADRNSKNVNFNGLMPVPQQRHSLMAASPYNTQLFLQQQQQQLYQNHQQIQLQMLKQQQILQQRKPRPLVRSDNENI